MTGIVVRKLFLVWWGPSNFFLLNPSLKGCFAVKMLFPTLKSEVRII